MTPQALKRAIANLIDDFCVLNKEVSELREHNRYLESRVSEESDYATLLARHNALVEAVKKERLAFDALDEARFQLGPVGASIWTDHAAARTEVDRLIGGE